MQANYIQVLESVYQCENICDEKAGDPIQKNTILMHCIVPVFFIFFLFFLASFQWLLKNFYRKATHVLVNGTKDLKWLGVPFVWP